MHATPGKAISPQEQPLTAEEQQQRDELVQQRAAEQQRLGALVASKADYSSVSRTFALQSFHADQINLGGPQKF